MSGQFSSPLFACKIKQSFLHLSNAVQITCLSNWMSSINANSDILSCPGRMSYASLCEQENKWCVEGMVRRFWVELVENKVGMAEEGMRHLSETGNKSCKDFYAMVKNLYLSHQHKEAMGILSFCLFLESRTIR